MTLDIHLGILILGVLLTVFGASVIFNEQFFRLMNSSLWKASEQDRRNWSAEGRYRFNKYGRGLGALLGGIILLMFALKYYFGLP
jgi:hypothetical protein